jgi:hypothetical protein
MVICVFVHVTPDDPEGLAVIMQPSGKHHIVRKDLADLEEEQSVSKPRTLSSEVW